MNREQIIPSRTDVLSMAREAGFVVDGKAQQHQPNCIFHTHHMVDELLERFAALVAAAAEERWKQAVINELVCCHIYNAAHDNDPRKALHDAISWNVQVALDPQVSSDAQALIDRGAAAEREACAKVCDEYSAVGKIEEFDRGWLACAKALSNVIRARGETSSRSDT